MGSNGRFVLGVLLGLFCGGGLYHLLTDSTPTLADESHGLVPGGVARTQPPVLGTNEAGGLPSSRIGDQRELAPATHARAEISDADVDTLVAGISTTEAVAATGSGTIWGQVVDGEDTPLADVVLRLSMIDSRSSSTKTSSIAAEAPELDTLEDAVRKAAERFHESRSNMREVVTDASGRYRIQGLADRKWRLEAYLAGYQLRADTNAYDVSIDSEVDFTATRVIEVPVQVFEPNGRLAQLALLNWKEVGASSRRGRNYAWSSDEAFLRLAPGKYTIHALSDDGGIRDGSDQSSEDQEVLLSADAEVTPLRFDLRARLGITGLVKVETEGVEVDRLTVSLAALAPTQEVDLESMVHSDKNDSVRPGSEFSFQDLDPGRYVIGLSHGWGGSIVAHEVVEVVDGPVRQDLVLPPLDRSRHISVDVHGPDGEPLEKVSFSVQVKRASRTSTSPVTSLREKGGGYLLRLRGDDELEYFGEKGSEATFQLVASKSELGKREVPLVRGQTDVSVTFVVPGTLEVTVAGYQGSGYEGRLSVNAHRQSSDPSRRFFGSSGRDKMSPEGVQEFKGLEPGLYRVVLSARKKGTSNRFFESTEIDSIEMEILPGSNTLQMRIPALYTLRVHWADGKEGTNISARPFDSGDMYGFGNARATLDGEGYAEFEDLRAGEYLISTWGGQALQMRVTVPSKEVEFVPMEVDALRVVITDENGDLAKLGFQHGDLIIGTDGEDFGDSPTSEQLGTLRSSKTAKVTFMVLRNGTQLDIKATGADIGDWSALGGQMVPAKR